MEWLTKFTQWITDLIKQLWSDIVDFWRELWVDIASQLLSAIADLINAIPVPDFLSSHSIGSIIGSFPSDISYFVGQLHLQEPMMLIAAGFAFRMTRKAFTLFRW